MATPGAGASAQTLSDALVQAYRSSPILEQQRFLLRATDENVAIAVSALRPAVSFATSYGKVRTSSNFGTSTATTSSLGLILDFTLVDAGQRHLRIAAEKESVLAARFNLIDIEQDVLLTAIDAYLDLREAVLSVDVSESNLRLLQEELRATRDRFEVGEVTPNGCGDRGIQPSGLALGVGGRTRLGGHFARIVPAGGGRAAHGYAGPAAAAPCPAANLGPGPGLGTSGASTDPVGSA
ncbi:MAG: TolC family protein [Pseudomonadota bacterium]